MALEHSVAKVLLLVSILFGGFVSLTAQQRGKASYYSKKATGARTSSGERIHHDSLTCAHRSYPFGTYLRVTNMSNDRSVIVRVTDRGPFTRGRIIDLSWAAAQTLGMLSQGVAPVTIERVDGPGVPYRDDGQYTLPGFDFELAEETFSFVDKWNDPKMPQRGNAGVQTSRQSNDGRTNSNARHPSAEGKQRTTQKNKATTHGQRGNPRQQGSATKRQGDKSGEQGSTKRESSVWSAIFDKLKY